MVSLVVKILASVCSPCLKQITPPDKVVTLSSDAARSFLVFYGCLMLTEFWQALPS